MKWDHASMAWMSQEFDSPILHHLRSISVAVNTSPCHGEDHGFDSRMLRQRSLRLSVRTRGFHPRKRGSTPLGTAINYYGPLAQLVEQFPFKEWVDGSSPSRLTRLVPVVQLDRIRVS